MLGNVNGSESWFYLLILKKIEKKENKPCVLVLCRKHKLEFDILNKTNQKAWNASNNLVLNLKGLKKSILELAHDFEKLS